MRLWFPPPAPETTVELDVAASPFWRRFTTAFFATAAMVALLFSGGRLLDSSLVAPLATMASPELLSEALLLAGALLVTQLFIGLRNVGLRLRGALPSFAMMAPMLVLSLLDGGPPQLPKVTTIVSIGLLCLMIGVAEEVYGRGLLVTALGGRRHAALAIVGSSIGFAYFHMPNYAEKYGWRAALVMSTASAAYSCTGAIVRLRTGSIVGLIVFHVLDDWRSQVVEVGGAAANQSEPSARAIIIGCVISTIYWLLCRRGIRVGLTSPNASRCA